jgi:DNA (cytosine-5)-methyltransferase 1
MKTRTGYRAIDLFAGCGGLTLGLRKAGYSVIAAVEKDSEAVRTYKQNHPNVTVFEKDIQKLTVTEFARALRLRSGDLDLLAGCPPCQGFSAMRTLNGKKRNKDRQNDLIFDFLRFVRGLKPKAVMMENVPGLATTRRLRTFVQKLKKAGYAVEYDVFNAADYGVPQRRRRLVLIASRLSRDIEFATPEQKRVTVRQALRKVKTRANFDPLQSYKEDRSERIKALIKKIPKNGGSRSDLGKSKQLKCHKACDGFKDVYGRMRWDDVAPTITSGCTNPSKGRFLHPTKNRAITLREASLLQSFPLGYKFPIKAGRSAIALMIGNALPPRFIAAHARALAHQLKAKASA